MSCVNCHGGDATKSDKAAAHAVSAGFAGVPNQVDIPALCASCHSNVDAMRQYDLPTDQYAKYLTSVHGQKLAQGDTKVDEVTELLVVELVVVPVPSLQTNAPL